MTRKSGTVTAEGGFGPIILSALRDEHGVAVSGAYLSKKLMISRTAVWKQINTLRDRGYVIEADPARGYRLVSTPDIYSSVGIQSGLHVKRIGRRIVCLDETVSTNSTAFKLAEEGALEGTVVISDRQSGGKGRLGRTWVSPPGVNLYCSVILRPDIMPMSAPQLTFLSAVAVARGIDLLTSLETRIKWPNDVLIGGRKVAGLLNEMSAETDKVNFVILGVGVNLNMTPEQFPVDLRTPPTSLLAAGGRPVSRVDFARIMLQELDSLYDVFLGSGYGPVREEWFSRSRLAGETVTVSDHGREQRGRVVGIDEYGALLLETENGEVRQILSGDISIG